MSQERGKPGGRLRKDWRPRDSCHCTASANDFLTARRRSRVLTKRLASMEALFYSESASKRPASMNLFASCSVKNPKPANAEFRLAVKSRLD